jgi:hypothetical protein
MGLLQHQKRAGTVFREVMGGHKGVAELSLRARRIRVRQQYLLAYQSRSLVSIDIQMTPSRDKCCLAKTHRLILNVAFQRCVNRRWTSGLSG